VQQEEGFLFSIETKKIILTYFIAVNVFIYQTTISLQNNVNNFSVFYMRDRLMRSICKNICENVIQRRNDNSFV